jgi:hypothetical protein
MTLKSKHYILFRFFSWLRAACKNKEMAAVLGDVLVTWGNLWTRITRCYLRFVALEMQHAGTAAVIADMQRNNVRPLYESLD